MEKKGARAVVVSGAIALLIAGVVFLLLKWRSGPLDIGSGSGSGSWLASLGIGTQSPQLPQAPVPTQPPYADDGYGYDYGAVPQQAQRRGLPTRARRAPRRNGTPVSPEERRTTRARTSTMP